MMSAANASSRPPVTQVHARTRSPVGESRHSLDHRRFERRSRRRQAGLRRRSAPAKARPFPRSTTQPITFALALERRKLLVEPLEHGRIKCVQLVRPVECERAKPSESVLSKTLLIIGLQLTWPGRSGACGLVLPTQAQYELSHLGDVVGQPNAVTRAPEVFQGLTCGGR